MDADFGETMCVYKPPINLKTTSPVMNSKPNGNKEILLNWITPHQKWGFTVPTQTICSC